MPKPMKYDKLFNKEVNGIQPNLKQRFLDTIGGRTQDTYRYILSKAYRYEEILNKDICEFNWNELDTLLRTYPNKSLSSVYLNVSCLNLYINFCIEKGFVPDMINYLSSIGGEESLSKYMDKRADENKYISRDKLIEIQKSLANDRDVVILELLFAGVKPDELSNLLISDCDFLNNTLKLIKDDNGIRVLDNISNNTMDIIKNAIEQKGYIDNNGFDYSIKTGESTKMLRGDLKLNVTGYVIRSTGKYKLSKVASSFITNIIARMKLYVDEPYLTPTNVWTSGLVDYAKQIQEQKGELQKEDYLFLQERFGINNTNDDAWKLTKRKIKNYI